MPVLKPLTVANSTSAAPRAAFRVSDTSGLVVAAGVRRRHHMFPVFPHDWTLYSEHIAPHATEPVGEHDAVVLAYLLYGYALRIANTKNMRKYTTIPKETITAARESLFASADLVRYKIATLRCVTRRLNPHVDMGAISQVFCDVGLRAADGVLFALLHFNSDIHAFVQLVAAIPDTVFTLDIDVLRAELDTPLAQRELKKTAGYFTHRQLKFIADGNRLGTQAIHNDLEMRGIQAYYWVRPFYDKLHAMNYAKRAIDCHAKNLIAYYNDPSRIRSFQQGDTGTFDNTIVAFTEYSVAHPTNVVEDSMVEWLDRNVA